MWKKILLALVVVIAGFAAFVASRPSAFRYERSARIDAPADLVFGYVSDFHQWDKWSPWEKLDPQMKKTHSGAVSGVGASYAWAGNKDVGEGRMTLTEATPPQKLVIKLEFLKPMEMTNTALFTFTPDGRGTTVTWAMTGENNFVGKAFGVFADMDKMIGKDFEKGLASLKDLAEADVKKTATGAPAAAKAANLPAPPAAADAPTAR